jgi:hypothetical protein
MKVGDTVKHPDFGQGRVLAIFDVAEGRSHGGRRTVCNVDFGYMRQHGIAIDQFDASDQADTVANNLKSGTATTRKSGVHPVLADDTAVARAGINALKLGQVLETQVERLTVGTDKDEGDFESIFDHAKSRKSKLILIEGAWGVGKTHLLTLLTAHALKRKFAVSATILDGCAASLSDPMRLLECITAGIRFPNDKVPMGIGLRLGEVKQRAMLELMGMGGDRLYKVLREVSASSLEDPEVIGVLEDYLGLSLAATQAASRLRQLGCGSISLPPLRARSIDERGARFSELLVEWAAFSVACKASGLLVVLDELDVDYAFAPRWNTDRRARQDMTLRAIGAIRKSKIPLVIAFGSAPAGPGGNSANDAVKDVQEKVGGVDLHTEAAKLTVANFHDLGQKIYELYEDSYPGFSRKFPKNDLRSVLNALDVSYRRQISPVPRRYVRALLHCFDTIDLGISSSTELLANLQ